MLFVGGTRFSLFVPESTAWHASMGKRLSSVDAYRDYLFSDERLALRTDTFLSLSLPQIERARGDHEVVHAVNYSSELPAKYRDLLHDAARTYDFLVLQECEGNDVPSPHELAGRELDEHHGQRAGHTFGLYRLDDDDVVSADFFDQMAHYVTPANQRMVVSLPRGVMAAYHEGRLWNLREAYVPMIAIGHMEVCGFDEHGQLVCPVSTEHNLADRSNGVVLDARRLSYIWMQHVTQDSALRLGDSRLAENDLVQFMGRTPVLELDATVRDAFPAIADRFGSDRVLLDRPRTLTSAPVPFELERPVSRLGLVLDMDPGGLSDQRAVVATLDLVDADGGPLEADAVARLAKVGIARSAREDVGFFRYVAATGTRQATDFAVALPHGVHCRAVSLRAWAGTDVTLHRVVLRER